MKTVDLLLNEDDIGVKVLWIVIVGLALWLCGKSIQTVLSEWKNHPVKVGFDDKTSPLETIPFPTITLCPDVKARPGIFNISHVRAILQGSEGNLTSTDWQSLEALAHICPNVLSAVSSSEKYKFQQKFADESIHDTIWNLSSSSLIFINPSNVLIIVGDDGGFITKMWTEEGICYSFNALNSRDIYTEEMAPYTMVATKNPSASNWSLEGGYIDLEDVNGYPKQALDHRLFKFSIHLQLRDGVDNNLCQKDIAGFKVFLNIPGEVPSTLQSVKSYTQPTFSQSIQISLTPHVTKTTEGLRKYAPNTRKCFFASERRLRFFKLYTKNNCQLECLATFLKQECGCVKLSMPRDNQTSICGAASIPCYRSAEAILFDDHEIDSMQYQRAKKCRETCNCLESCTSITYEATTALFENLGGFQIHLSFNIGQVKTLLQSELYTFAEFLSICGGLLGLFLGISALS